jgi:hypothetical protein
MHIARIGNLSPDPKELTPDADMTAVADGRNGRASGSPRNTGQKARR